MTIHQRINVQKNTIKKLKEVSLEHGSVNGSASGSVNNGYELPKFTKGPRLFKKCNPLFVVNSLIGRFPIIQIY